MAAQEPIGWGELIERFRQSSPGLDAARAELRATGAEEITAGLRPNPSLSYSIEEVDVPTGGAGWGWSGRQWLGGLEQVVELGGKRTLRIESARYATAVAAADYAEFERQTLRQLRETFIDALFANSLATLATEDLAAYDRIIALNRDRHDAGDISLVDLTRVELQRSHFEADSVSATLASRRARQELLASLNDPTPVNEFEVDGAFEVREIGLTRLEATQLALELRPDLRSATRARQWTQAEQRLARANAIADPQLGVGWQSTMGRNAMAFYVGLPLQLFDRNQGERERVVAMARGADATRRGLEAHITREVEGAFDAAEAAGALLTSYRDRYLEQAREVYETTSFSYQHGEASLLEFLDAEKAHRDARISYRELIARYLSALNQLDTATGREIAP